MRFAISFLSAIALALPATAQQMTIRQLPAQQAAYELSKYAICLASRRGPQARVAAMATYLSDEQNKAARDLMGGFDDSCITMGADDQVRMTVRPDVLAVAVAEALLERDYPDFVSVLNTAAIDVEAERATAAKLTVAERFGRCMVWNDPAGIEALLKTNPETRGEIEAINGLGHAMGVCVGEGSTIRFSRPFVRGIAALSAYRLAQQIKPRPNGDRN